MFLPLVATLYYYNISRLGTIVCDVIKSSRRIKRPLSHYYKQLSANAAHITRLRSKRRLDNDRSRRRIGDVAQLCYYVCASRLFRI